MERRNETPSPDVGAEFAQVVADLHDSYRRTAAALLGCEPAAVQLGWKLTHVDGTTGRDTSHPYQWPLNVLGGAGCLVAAEQPNRGNTGSCPNSPGDGLCAVEMGHIREATSGTARLASGQGHILAWTANDVLSSRPDTLGKLRLARVVDLGIFDPLDLIQIGLVPNLRGANLGGANLLCAYLRGANLGGANLGGANLGGANLGGANLRGANLRGANLGDANLGGVDLRGANLGDANLGGVDLGGVDLRDVDLRGADLRGANLGGANLGDANLGDAEATEFTRWPDGFDVARLAVS